MQRTEAGIRQLKSNLSAYLRQVKAGGTVIITERGKPIGRITPVAESVEERLEHLSQAGLVAWSGQTLSPLAPLGRTLGSRTVADLLLSNRSFPMQHLKLSTWRSFPRHQVRNHWPPL